MKKNPKAQDISLLPLYAEESKIKVALDAAEKKDKEITYTFQDFDRCVVILKDKKKESVK